MPSSRRLLDSGPAETSTVGRVGARTSNHVLVRARLRQTVWLACALLLAIALPSRAAAQQAPQQPLGFALERLYPSAPGGEWLVMDALDMRGGLGGAMALTAGYARNPLRIAGGSTHLAVVSDQAFADFGFAATYVNWRVYLNLDMPLSTRGQSGTVGAYQFHPPSMDLGSNPDTLSDARIGFDSRLVGEHGSRFRLGMGSQLIVPNGNRCNLNPDSTIKSCDYDTDGTLRAMLRVLFAGDVGRFSYAGHLGAHVRPLDDSQTPGSPQGSELLFGVAGGARLWLPRLAKMAIVVGPEIYGATALRSLLRTTDTALEGLWTGRLEQTGDEGPQVRVKLGAGAGLSQHFGAPEWRTVLAVEVVDHVRPTTANSLRP
jgi:hypothetical protein